MNCIQCERPAHGICCFCGRAICKDHFIKDQKIITLLPEKNEEQKDGKNQSVRALVVDNAIRCSECKPIGELLNVSLAES